jgi:hypothetical protein
LIIGTILFNILCGIWGGIKGLFRGFIMIFRILHPLAAGDLLNFSVNEFGEALGTVGDSLGTHF